MGCTHLPYHVGRAQRTACRSWLSLTLWVQGIQFRPLGIVTGAPTHEALSLAPNLRFLIAVLKIKLCLLNGSYMASHKDTSFVYFIVNCELTASDQWETGWAQELHLLTRTQKFTNVK